MSQPEDSPRSIPPEQEPVSAATGQEGVPYTGSGTLNTRDGHPAGSMIQLRDLGSHGEELPPAACRGLSMDLEGRYELSGVLGRGGMGEVFRGRDASLGRDLALKVLRDDHAHRADAVERFREEAQIGGQLQHPGVVPVYELGCLGDGRPYFTMKLVKGVTLEKLLHDRHDAAQDRPRFLKVFEQVCQAVAYAHARGVLHRDLKPSNVMVGAFGEVQVMDWGLAKVLGDKRRKPRPAGSATASIISTDRDGSSGSETREGDVLGTPAYMPPEQALGEVDRLDERCDVFSLGAILCEVLTGQPLYAGADGTVVLRKARRAEQDEALSRLDGCGADSELIALTRRCLAIEPEQRPRHAGEVARAVEAYLASVEERLRQAELERAESQARAEAEALACEAAQAKAAAERRARRLTLGLAVLVLVMVVLGGSTAVYLHQEQLNRHAEQTRKQLEVEQAVERDLAEVTERQAQTRWAEAWAALQRAEGRMGESGSEALRERIGNARHQMDRVRIEQDTVSRLEEARQLIAGVGADQAFSRAEADKAFGEAFARYGLEIEKLTPGYNGLGLALRDLGKLDEAVAAFRKADHLLPTYLQPLRDNLRQTERWVQFAPKLDAYLAGKEKPANPQESVELAQFCASYREQYRGAVRFYADAFKSDPKLANNLPAAHRSRAAYYAALAGAGKGKDAPATEQERVALRRQSLDWLRANLEANSGLVDKAKENRPVVRRRLTSWLQATELASVRAEKAVAALPEAERKEWQQFWANVKGLVKKIDNDF